MRVKYDVRNGERTLQDPEDIKSRVTGDIRMSSII